MDSAERGMERAMRYGGYAGLAATAAALAFLAYLPTDPLWWLVRLPGMLAFFLAPLTLFLPPSSSRLRLHRLVGSFAIISVSAHILLVAALEPSFWRWLTPAMPVEIILGIIAAFCLFATLWVQRSRNLRTGMGPPRTLLVHRIAGFAVCFAGLGHVVLIAGTATALILLAVAGMALIIGFALTRERRLLPIIAIPIVLSSLAALWAGPLAQMRLADLRSSPVDHARFDHAGHADFTCVSCHHNYTDTTGSEICITCHKRISVSETMRVDRMFHAFCTDCHRREREAGRKSGPIDHCTACHGNS